MGDLALVMDDIFRLTHRRPEELAPVVLSFLDVSTTAYGRATHYNTRDQQNAAEMHVHGDLFVKCRDLYETLLLLPGTTDRARQIGISSLLANPRNGEDVFLTPAMERMILERFIRTMPPQRVFKLFDSFRGRGDGGEFGTKRANNARTRKLILRTILNSPRLELWVVKYRDKVRRSLVHAWGRKLASFIGESAKVHPKRSKMDPKQVGALKDHVFKYVGDGQQSRVCHCIAFLFGKRKGFPEKLKLLKAFETAKVDLSSGSVLPTEILEGIRSTFHKDVPSKDILGLKAKSRTMTTHEKRVVQKRAKAAGVEVEMRADDYSAVELYTSVFEDGMNQLIQDALNRKAKEAAASMPFSYKKIGILLDASKSMEGSREQPMRPMAVALALRDTLMATAEDATVAVCGGGGQPPVHLPKGATGLSEALLVLLMADVEAVFVISDGYENAPAGRFGDVLRLAREMGDDTPVIHMNPVFAAESGAVRALCEGVDKVATLPVKSPEAVGTTLVRGLIESDPRSGLENLVRMALSAGGPGFERLGQGGAS